jgi:hypothetical protein
MVRKAKPLFYQLRYEVPVDTMLDRRDSRVSQWLAGVTGSAAERHCCSNTRTFGQSVIYLQNSDLSSEGTNQETTRASTRAGEYDSCYEVVRPPSHIPKWAAMQAAAFPLFPSLASDIAFEARILF